MGCPASPFIGERKAQITTEKKKKNEREEGFQDRWILLHTDPTDPVDINRDGSTAWPCSSLTFYFILVDVVVNRRVCQRLYEG